LFKKIDAKVFIYFGIYLLFSFSSFGQDKCKHGYYYRNIEKQFQQISNLHIYGDTAQNLVKIDRLIRKEKNEILKDHLYLAKMLIIKNDSIKHHYLHDIIFNKPNVLNDCKHADVIVENYLLTSKKNNIYQIKIATIYYLKEINRGLSDEYIYESLGNLFYYLQDYELALNFFKLQLKIKKGQKAIASLHNNIGLAYKALGHKDEAYEAFHNAWRLWGNKDTAQADLAYSAYFKLVIESNMEDIKEDRSIEKLIEITKKRIQVAKLFNRAVVFENYIQLAYLYLSMENYEAAKTALTTAEKDSLLGIRPLSVKSQLRYHSVKEQLYINSNNSKKAQYHKKELHKVRKLINQNKKKAKKEALFLDKFWNAQLLVVKEESLNHEQRLNKRLYILSGILILVSIWLVYMIINQKKIQRKLIKQSRTLNIALENSKFLMNEVYHRVKNNLQMVTSIAQIDYYKNKGNFDFQNFNSKISALTIVHEQLYKANQINEINIKDYLQQLFSTISKSYSAHFDYQLDIDGIYCSSQKAIHLGLLINELISNSLKHADSGENTKLILNFSLKHDIDDIYTIDFYDSGKPSQNVNHVEKSFGQSLIKMIVQELEGEIIPIAQEPFRLKAKLKNLNIWRKVY
jgi:two-component sensor histidine kinase